MSAAKTIAEELVALRFRWRMLDWRARNPRTDAREATEAAMARDELTPRIADLEEKIQTAEAP